MVRGMGLKPLLLATVAMFSFQIATALSSPHFASDAAKLVTSGLTYHNWLIHKCEKT